jgi:hypothetical protein
MSHEETIAVVYADRPEPDRSDLEGTRSFGTAKLMPQVGEVDTGTLGRSLRRLTAQMNDLFDEVSDAGGAFELTSFDVAVEITGTGEVRLIGAVSVELTGGISLTFTRRNDAAAAGS